ncbi:hypothetical protein RJ639_017007 [Escallonia herrerae]|uniref:C2H2-type domain-containing protein n=1 Tax=Escallonia herrerae TaxID=1293975 RepID=A0AA88VBE6_9ASTE|nr:hypothetical protein RJ639_017007 [Escallonia herrerae]
MLDNTITPTSSTCPSSSSDHAFTEDGGHISNNKRKRRPAGTPDPDAEVVSLSPKTLLESDRYVCEICNQGFQRDQNLQMHRRRHKVPWKLLKRESPEVRKRVFVCPEPSCLHHDPCHALGDLVGIKKHFRRKHSNNKQWVCEKCSKGYAVQSDYKAHLKTCGTRGHSCDCGRVFSRVESFIEHQDTCTVRPTHPPELPALQPACSSRTASSTSPSSDTNFSVAPLPSMTMPTPTEPVFLRSDHESSPGNDQQHNLELQLLPTSSANYSHTRGDDNHATHLKLSIGSCDTEANLEALRLKQGANEQLRLAMVEKAFADETRQQAKRQIDLAELEFANAKRVRQQAQAEIEKARVMKVEATMKVGAALLDITCHACKQHFQAMPATAITDETSLATSYMSSAITEGEGE